LEEFLDRETSEIRSLVENAGFDYSVFASLDGESQQEILASLKRRRTNPQAEQAPHAAPNRSSYSKRDSLQYSSQLLHSSGDTTEAKTGFLAEGQGTNGASRGQLDVAICILAEFFPSLQFEAIADMLQSMGLRLDEAVDAILEDVSTSGSKRKSSLHTSVSRLDAVRQLGASRSGVEGADWKSVYSWISASTGQSSNNSTGSSSADASLDSLVAFMKVAMNVDDPAAGVEQVANMRD
jgi:hypothetical protein